MQAKRKRYSAKFKSAVALEALKEQKTLSEISSEYGVHSNQISLWKKQLLIEAENVFSNKRQRQEKEQEHLETELYRQIGQLKVELDWLKKKIPGKHE
ncbi:MAG: transposase [Desulfobacterales bacterium]|nr:transposase [Desulfobacterales bacterium]